MALAFMVKQLTMNLKLVTNTFISFALLTTQPAGANQGYIFPGDPLPGDLSFQPLNADSSPSANIQLLPMHWFLLSGRTQLTTGMTTRSQATASSSENQASPLTPSLNNYNAQAYYRLMVGLILQETLVKNGYSIAEAKRYLETAKANGKDINTASLAEIGEVPQSFQRMYRDWNVSVEMNSVLPRLVLPLTIAFNKSHLQQFRSASASENTDSQRQCTNIETLPPLAAKQTELSSEKEQLNSLNDQVLNATTLYSQTINEVQTLTTRLQNETKAVDFKQRCLDAFTNQVNNGTSQGIDAACLKEASEVMQALGKVNQWDQFVNTSLKNATGDFQAKVLAEANLKKTQERLAQLNDLVNKYYDSITMADVAIKEKRETLKEINAAIGILDSEDQTLNAELTRITEEYTALLEEQQRVDRNVYRSDLSAQEKTELDALNTQTANRRTRMERIQERRPEIIQLISDNQQNRQALLTQRNFEERALNQLRMEIVQATTKVGSVVSDSLSPEEKEKVTGYLNDIAKEQTNFDRFQQEYTVALDKFNVALSVLNILEINLFELASKRDQLFGRLKAETEKRDVLRGQVEQATLARDGRVTGIEDTVRSILNSLAAYKSTDEMGWFLEQDCVARKELTDNKEPGIYLARSVETTGSINPENGQVESGRWGAFSVRYQDFRNRIANGALLNIQTSVRLGVESINEIYQYVMTRSFQEEDAKTLCSGFYPDRHSNSQYNYMRSTFSIWNQGSSPTARESGFCDFTKGGDVHNQFESDLKSVITFKDSILDKVLPARGQAKPEDLIERLAMESLSFENSYLTWIIPQPRPGAHLAVTSQEKAESLMRRDQTIKSLIQVLAYDYLDLANRLNQSSDTLATYKFASQAPSKATLAAADPVKVGDRLQIKSLRPIVAYVEPVATESNLATTQLGFNDLVELQALGEDKELSQVATKGGWARVLLLNRPGFDSKQSLWVSVSDIVTASKTTAEGVSSDLAQVDCPNPREVIKLDNFSQTDRVVSRINPDSEIATSRSTIQGIEVAQVPWQGNTMIDRVDVGDTFIACEVFQLDGVRSAPENLAATFNRDIQGGGFDYGTALAVRLIKAQRVTSPSGSNHLVPLEDRGGYAQVWFYNRSQRSPRIIVGEALDARTWQKQSEVRQ